MTTLIVTADNQVALEGGKVGYGTCTMGSRSGSYETYAVRLSSKAASLVEIGDTIEYWRGKSDWCIQDAGGQIIKADGRKIQITGSADNGIDTGHPPHLGLKMIQAPKLCWEAIDSSFSINVIKHIETGEVFYSGGKCYPSSIEHARKSYEAFYSPEIKLTATQKAEFTWYGNPMYGFQSGWWRSLKKVIKLVDTDKPVIL